MRANDGEESYSKLVGWGMDIPRHSYCTIS
jgi:hypothetical protein